MKGMASDVKQFYGAIRKRSQSRGRERWGRIKKEKGALITPSPPPNLVLDNK